MKKIISRPKKVKESKKVKEYKLEDISPAIRNISMSGTGDIVLSDSMPVQVKNTKMPNICVKLKESAPTLRKVKTTSYALVPEIKKKLKNLWVDIPIPNRRIEPKTILLNRSIFINDIKIHKISIDPMINTSIGAIRNRLQSLQTIHAANDITFRPMDEFGTAPGMPSPKDDSIEPMQPQRGHAEKNFRVSKEVYQAVANFVSIALTMSIDEQKTIAHLLSEFNDAHGHALQPLVDKLRKNIKKLERMPYQPFLVNTNRSTIVGGMISNLACTTCTKACTLPCQETLPCQQPGEAVAETVDVCTPAVPAKTRDEIRPGQLLFLSLDEELHWAKVFMDFLTQHNRASEKLTTEVGNYINRTLACFYQQWKKRGLLNERAQTNAPTIFLLKYCKIQTVVTDRSHSAHIKEKLESALAYEQDDKKSNLIPLIEEIVKNNLI